MGDFCPQGLGLGFASGDTNPALFSTTDTCLALVVLGDVSNHTSCVRQGKTNQGPVARLDCGEGQTEGPREQNFNQVWSHSVCGHVGP